MNHNMSRTIVPYMDYVATDSIVWPFQVNRGGDKQDLSNATVEYYIVEREGEDDSNPTLDHNDPEVTVDVEPSGPKHDDAPSDTTGYIEVIIQRGNLDYGRDVLWHRLRVEDDASGRRTWSGDFPINDQ